MAQNTEEVMRDIESTRQDLSRDVEALSEKVSPGRIVRRRVDVTKGRLSSLKETIMGSSSSGGSAVSGSLSGTGSGVADKVSQTPDMLRRQTEGNPLAAGLVAFAGGWLISSLLPATQAEQHAAQAVQARASDMAEPLKQELSEVAAEMKDNLQQPAQQALQSVKDSATDAAATVKEEGAAAATSVKNDAQHSTQRLTGEREGPDEVMV